MDTPSRTTATLATPATSIFSSARTKTTTTPEQIVQLGRPPNRIDLLTSISGVSFEDAWASRVVAQLDGLPVAFLGLEALLENKRASGRAKDLADVEELEQRRGEG